MHLRLPLLFLFCAFILEIEAQQPTWLPRFRAPGESDQAGQHRILSPSQGAITQPPVVPVRMMAEWEELQSIAITWKTGVHNDILAEIVRAVRTECKVLIHCNSETVINQAKAHLLASGVDLSSNVQFVIARSNSLWIRDYGPSTVYAHDVDSLWLVDWIYNRPRYNDDTLSATIAQSLNVPLYTTTLAPYDLVNTGGNVMTDGMGTAFSSKLVLEENGSNNVWGQSNHNEAAVDTLMRQFMGIKRYLKMDILPYDGIHHLDMHFKMLDEETLLIGEYPPNVSDGPQIEANIYYLLSKLSAFGRSYRVVRVPMPSFGGQYPPYNGDPNKAYLYPTYANALIVNKIILMPKYNLATDDTAQKIFEKAMPGYKVVPINCTSIVDEGGAIRCALYTANPYILYKGWIIRGNTR
jgi:agmatine/peptidylarginine deiminase